MVETREPMSADEAQAILDGVPDLAETVAVGRDVLDNAVTGGRHRVAVARASEVLGDAERLADSVVALHARVAELIAQRDAAWREGAEAMREEATRACADIAAAHDALCIRKFARGEGGVSQEYGAAQCGAECATAIRALPLPTRPEVSRG